MDGGNPSRSAVTNVTILVLDVNDNAPIFSPESYTKTIKENALHSTLVRHPIVLVYWESVVARRTGIDSTHGYNVCSTFLMPIAIILFKY